MTQPNQCPYDEGAVCVDAPKAPEDCWEDREKRDERCQSYTIYHQRAEIDRLCAENERLRKSVRDHEEDCACLPEDYSVTETVKALRGRVEGLEKALVAMIGLYDNDDWYNDKVASEAKAALEGGSRE